MATNADGAAAAKDAVLRDRIALTLVRVALSPEPAPEAPEGDGEAADTAEPVPDTVEQRVEAARSRLLIDRVLSDPVKEGTRAQWAVAATDTAVVDAYASKGAAGVTDAMLETAVRAVWDALRPS